MRSVASPRSEPSLDPAARLLQAAVSILALRPLRFVEALITTLRMMRRSDRAPHIHIFYLIEACGVAAVVRRSGAVHIHAHFGTNPAELALLASQLSGASYSFTVHGYDEFDRPEFIGMRTKIHGSACICIAICSTAKPSMMLAEMAYLATVGSRCSRTRGKSLFMDQKPPAAHARSCRASALRDGPALPQASFEPERPLSCAVRMGDTYIPKE